MSGKEKLRDKPRKDLLKKRADGAQLTTES